MNFTFHFDISGIVGLVIVAITALYFLSEWISQSLCKHDGGVNETMSCDAICRKCGKNLGFIGTWRDKQKKITS